MQSSVKLRFLIAIVMALVAVFSYYSKTSVNPITGEVQRVNLTPEQEIAMGLQSAPQMAAEFGGLYNDPQVQNYVKSVGKKLVEHTDAAKSPYQFDFHVLEDPQTVNAFALPGGQIFITMGLLRRLETEDQLAGVLGHEIGHVIGRHSAEHMAQQDLTRGLISATAVATYDGSGNQSAYLAQYVGQIVNLKFGREDELESDDFGVKYMLQSSYDPEALIGVMKILAEASGGNRPSEFMSSHPSPENRVQKINEAIAKYKGSVVK